MECVWGQHEEAPQRAGETEWHQADPQRDCSEGFRDNLRHLRSGLDGLGLHQVRTSGRSAVAIVTRCGKTPRDRKRVEAFGGSEYAASNGTV